MRPFLLVLGLCFAQAAASASDHDLQTVKVERSGQTLRFAPFGGRNSVLVQCPQRSMTGHVVRGTLVWPRGGGLIFDYALQRMTVGNALATANWSSTPPAARQLRLWCDGNTPKLEAGAGLKVLEEERVVYLP